jgi:hypothetical protein
VFLPRDFIDALLHPFSGVLIAIFRSGAFHFFGFALFLFAKLRTQPCGFANFGEVIRG